MRDLATLLTEYEARYSEENIRAKAREDGVRGIPGPEYETLSPFEDEILNAAQIVATKVAGECRGRLETVDAELKAHHGKAEQALKDEELRIQDAFQVNRNLQEQAFALRSCRDRHDVAKRRFDTTFNKVGRMPLRYIPHWMYVIFALIIFLGEIPLNAMVFQIFGENQVMTWVMAFVIGLSIPLLAHFVGIKMREHPDGLHWPNMFKAIAVAGLVTIALWGLSRMRHDYLFAMKDQLGLTTALVESSYLFFWLNLAVFGAATFLSYLSHDPIPGYDRLQDELRISQRKLRAEEEKKQSALKWLEMDRVNQLAKAREQFRNSIAATVKLKGEYDRVLLEGRQHESSCLLLARKEVAIYRHENIRTRPTGSPPKVFKCEIHFPLALQNMKEKLDNEHSP